MFLQGEEGELDTVISYSYPWLPPRCISCKRWGHLNSGCLFAETSVSQDKINSDLVIAPPQEKEEEQRLIDVGEVGKESETESLVLVTAASEENKQDGWITPKSRGSPENKNGGAEIW